MKPYLHLDFESASTQELGGNESVGLDNYWRHLDTQILMLAYAFGDGEVKLWEPHKCGEMPTELYDALKDDEQPLMAWNSSFERYGLECKCRIITKIERWHDPQASARYLSLPGSLDTVGDILALSPELKKDKRGEELIKLFSEPHKMRKKRGEPDVWFFYNHLSRPDEWQEFCNYCKQDVVAEREIMRKEKLLRVFPLPEFERKVWVFDQTVNDRGMPVDVEFVRKMYELGTRSKREAVEKQNQLTGLENANSPKQMIAWAKEQGYEPGTLRKETVTAQLAYHVDTMTPLCREVLEARKAASSTTYKKLAAVLRQVSVDGRLRNAFLYMGSSRCGRWSSAAVQLHNLARPGVLNGYNFEDEDVVDEARRMVNAMDYDGIQAKYSSVLLVIKFLIRTIFSVEQCKP